MSPTLACFDLPQAKAPSISTNDLRASLPRIELIMLLELEREPGTHSGQ
jgi:hypothetical protein